jgi:sulfite reductase (NADPH) flavoprotein alpha-component
MNRQSAGVLPLDSVQSNNLQSAVSGLSSQQLQWVSGYAAGLAAAAAQSTFVSEVDALSVAVNSAVGQTLTVLFGSQTGNGEDVAAQLVDSAIAEGFAAESVSMADYKPANLKRDELVAIVVSTHGEGDPPDDAELLHEYLLSEKAPELKKLKFSVLALGDSSYVNFCQTGREIDARLAELGAERLESLLECDLDYDDQASEWTQRLVARLPDLIDKGEPVAIPILRAVDVVSLYGKTNPFPAEVLVNQKITGGSSSKDVRHIELSLEGSGLSYEPGDSLAVISENPPQLVAEILAELNLDGDALVIANHRELKLADALKRSLEITSVNLGFLRDWAELASVAGNDELSLILGNNDSQVLSEFVDNHQIIDVVRLYPADVDARRFANMLRRLSPRSYSISSSLAANPDEVHLTVASVNYDAFGSEHWGAASTHLVDRVNEGDRVSVYVERNSRFRLPHDDVPVIMIGPGTGIAPFRAFVEERFERAAPGANWLFFGDRNFDSDFLYQLEWQRHRKRGTLQRLNVAFSRDQANKIYVQDLIRENGVELNRWIENGAHIYVCGDAKSMARDVNAALSDVLVAEGGLDASSAEQKLKELRSLGRYQRDVY